MEKERRPGSGGALQKRGIPWKRNLRLARQNWALYVMLLPAVVMIITFSYVPMYGIQIAFRWARWT